MSIDNAGSQQARQWLRVHQDASARITALRAGILAEPRPRKSDQCGADKAASAGDGLLHTLHLISPRRPDQVPKDSP